MAARNYWQTPEGRKRFDRRMARIDTKLERIRADLEALQQRMEKLDQLETLAAVDEVYADKQVYLHAA